MSSKQDAVIAFFGNILTDVGIFDASGEGFLSYLADGLPRPVTISEKRLCLPTRNVLEDGIWDKRVAFNPLAEQISQGPSPVLNALKEYIQIRLKGGFTVLATELMSLAADTRRQKGLKAEASKFLSGLVDADQKTADTLQRVLAATGSAPEKRLVSLFLKNGGEGGALRSCVVSFPIMDDAYTEDTTTFFGVKMPRKTKDKHLIVNLLDYVLGNEEERKSYSKVSNDREAPYFHALLLSFHAMATRLNKLIDIHKASCPALADFRMELEWTEALVDFAAFAATNGSAIPVLPGNRGKEREEAIKKAAEAVYETSADDIGLEEEPRENRRDPLSRADEREAPRRDRDIRDEPRRDRDREEPRRRDDAPREATLAEILGRRENDRDRDRGGRNDRGSSRDRDRDRDDGGRGGRYSTGRGTRRW